MPLPNQTWTTSLPGSQDTVGVEQPDLSNDSAPGANDGHRVLVEHLHALRDKAQYCAETIGDTNDLPAGSLKDRVSTLESAPATDVNVKADATDNTPDVLTNKLDTPAVGISKTVVDTGGGDRQVRLALNFSSGGGAGYPVEDNDPRMSDARTPNSHAASHQDGGGDEVATATAGANAIPKAGAGGTLAIGWIPTGTDASSVCIGNDSRLSDARTPTSHASSHQDGGGDEVATATAAANAIPKAGAGGTLAIGWIPTGTDASSVCIGNDSRLSDARTPTSHASSHQHSGGDEIATATAAANAIPKAGAGGTLAIGWIPTGTDASSVCIGNDSRLSDARTPTSHASTHEQGGSDVPVRHYGEAYVSTPAATTTSQTPTFTKIAGTYTAGELSGFTHSAGTLTYTGTNTKKFRVTAVISGDADGTDDYQFRLAKNGTDLAKTQIVRSIAGSNDIGVVAIQGIIELATNDTLQVEVARVGATARDVTADNLNLMATEI